MHKRPYLRLLNLKTVLPHLQTLPIAGTASTLPCLFTGIDAVAQAIGPWPPSLTFLPEMNGRPIASLRRVSAILKTQPSASVRVQRPGDGEKDARF
jgi:hypothetical protein